MSYLGRSFVGDPSADLADLTASNTLTKDHSANSTKNANKNSKSNSNSSDSVAGSLGMFDMEGIDDLDGQQNTSTYQFSDDQNSEDSDSNDEAEEASEQMINQRNSSFYSTSFKIGSSLASARSGDFLISTAQDALDEEDSKLENEENEEMISNLPINIGKMGAGRRRRQTNADNDDDQQMKQYAKSLPIMIPNFKSLNSHHAVEETDLDRMSMKDNPEFIAESIKALARSVRDGTEMFGDLPTRKFTASDLVKGRPN